MKVLYLELQERHTQLLRQKNFNKLR